MFRGILILSILIRGILFRGAFVQGYSERGTEVWSRQCRVGVWSRVGVWIQGRGVGYVELGAWSGGVESVVWSWESRAEGEESRCGVRVCS